MFDSNHYIPILKWKRGEQKALEYVSAQSKLRMTPLIEIVPVPYDYANEQPAKTIDAHLTGIGEQLTNSWQSDRPIFVDLYWVDPNQRMTSGTHPLLAVIDDARSHSVRLIPVTGFNRDANYQQAVISANQQDRLGICVRIEDDDFLDIDTNLADLLSELEISPEEVDLVIDLKEKPLGSQNANIMTVTAVINGISNINQYRTLTVAASSFPATLSTISAGSVGSIPRVEWELWRLLNTRRQTLRRMPAFGDYAIANPIYSEIDPRIMQLSANIRYTVANDWLIFRGRSVKVHGWGQARTLAQAIVAHSSFSGANFSWGDQYIYDCATSNCSTGNAETWRRVGTNHHLEFVIDQISSYTATLAAASQTAATQI